MKTISEQELKDILDKHGKYLRGEDGGARANLSSANLRFADLSFADLRFADLSSANLRFADLRFADLSSANLRFADLIVFQFQRHQAFYTLDGTLRIGCHVLPIVEWAETFKDIGKNNGYSEAQIKAYGQFIGMCLEMFKEEK